MADSARWERLWRLVGNRPQATELYVELVSHYSEPHRHYHTLTHISDILTEFDSARWLTTNALALELAIWFHDAVYDTHAADNEERSADMARKRITEAGGPTALAEMVSHLIMATKTHHAGWDQDARLMVDLDLAIFGKPPEQFGQYEKQIRLEYHWVPEVVFRAKRAEILERFLARPRIYSTDNFSSEYEQQARANLRRSIQQLRAA